MDSRAVEGTRGSAKNRHSKGIFARPDQEDQGRLLSPSLPPGPAPHIGFHYGGGPLSLRFPFLPHHCRPVWPLSPSAEEGTRKTSDIDEQSSLNSLIRYSQRTRTRARKRERVEWEEAADDLVDLLKAKPEALSPPLGWDPTPRDPISAFRQNIGGSVL